MFLWPGYVDEWLERGWVDSRLELTDRFFRDEWVLAPVEGPHGYIGLRKRGVISAILAFLGLRRGLPDPR